jgi:hypothetical protein
MIHRRSFLVAAGTLAAAAVVTRLMPRLASGPDDEARELYWQFDVRTSTWSLTPDRAREAGRLVDGDGSGTLRLVPLGAISSAARLSRVERLAAGCAVRRVRGARGGLAGGGDMG